MSANWEKKTINKSSNYIYHSLCLDTSEDAAPTQSSADPSQQFVSHDYVSASAGPPL